ncbi:MAG: DAK2 domain-containing protein, partial [Oscillospiraceae bacterium]|nr:DAK2 domain-containing protein [Oscillospiraceae bacterium]
MTQQITGALFKEMVINGAAAINNHKEEINELNVFPVPDGDTGTNMSLTAGNAAKELERSNPGTVSRAADITSNAMLRGARGNSGVITSLLFRGVAKHLKDMDSADAVQFAGAMASGVESAYKAVMKPAEGTILTVSRLTADAAVKAAENEDDIELVLEKALEAGRTALENTVNQNPVLSKAGVVDAGGKGYLYVLEGMLKSLRGEKIELETSGGDKPVNDKADFTGFETEDIRFTYCTEFIVSRKFKKDPNELRDFLDKRGDSVVVVDDDEIIKVHVHSNEPGNIITKALTYGPLLTVKIENMRQQHTEKIIQAKHEGRPKVAPVKPEKKYGIVSVCAGAGLESIFRDLGADGIITGGQTMNPSTDDLMDAINSTPAEIVYVLPNNKNIIMAAQQCVGLTPKQVVVIPTATIPQGISAMLSFEPENDEPENTSAMKTAAENVHTVLVTYAARDSEFEGTRIKAGEYLVLLE